MGTILAQCRVDASPVSVDFGLSRFAMSIRRVPLFGILVVVLAQRVRDDT
jgi:hypothetical protein